MESGMAAGSGSVADVRTGTSEDVKEALRLIEDLKFFLATAPANWQENQVIRRYYLNHDEGFVSCVYWNNLYFITGTDIVRCIVYKFEKFGRKITDRKKFEEGIFSDLRNLKCGTDAILEPPRSEFLDFLFKNSCLRTQKKQKVFFWFNVPHDKLMADALERDMKKEKLGQNPTTEAHTEPALSFKYDESKNLYQQLADHMESQKQLNESVSDTNSYDSKSSPEYTSPEAEKRGTEVYEFMNQETPAEFKAASDYEDDFPLDYFDSSMELSTDPNEYIALDSNVNNFGYMGNEDSYESYESSMLLNSTAQYSTNPLIYNDEYLIEQTYPVRTPIHNKPSQSTAPKMLYLDDQHSNFATGPPSSKYQTFQRVVPTPQHPLHHHNIQQSPFIYDQPNTHFQPVYMPSEGYSQGDYWSPSYPNPPVSAGYDSVMPYSSQPYVTLSEQDSHLPPSMVQVISPAMMSMQNQNQYQMGQLGGYSVPSTRQQQISANMMKKKRQLFQQGHHLRGGSNVSKSTDRFKRSRQGVDTNMAVRDARLTPGKRNYSLDATEVLMPTPESSVTNSSEQHKPHNTTR